ncbi:MAG TPA: erythromycin esterase family protein [Vicinamibacteria bacterium]|jgi:erythromycin esterase-like protein
MAGSPADYDALLDRIGEARFVLIGEASHGTHEFYRHRAEITQRLIAEKGFTVVAVEADWPDAYRVNRFVRGQSSLRGGRGHSAPLRNDDEDAADALDDFKRFPQWMWRNADVLDFVGWLRAYNEKRGGGERRAGFYGLDLYSLHTSMEAVLSYLDRVDPEAARRARQRYACFDHYGEDTQAYGYAAGFGLTPSCEAEVLNQLVELRRRAAEYARLDGRVAADEFFFAEQNARLVKNAEEYYRTMFRGDVSSWNLRDTHMVETLDSLVAHLTKLEGETKAVVWAHNSHLGDARATEMSRRGELNVGQLVRQRHGDEAVLVGFTTYTGTVTAANDWDAPAERKRVVPGLAGSYEALFHEVSVPQFLLVTRDAADAVAGPLLERAIGVIYRPQTERLSHYFQARLAQQFDAVIHVDETRAVEPLERVGEPEPEVPETFPSGV